jgi:hypothetical protein
MPLPIGGPLGGGGVTGCVGTLPVPAAADGGVSGGRAGTPAAPIAAGGGVIGALPAAPTGVAIPGLTAGGTLPAGGVPAGAGSVATPRVPRPSSPVLGASLLHALASRIATVSRSVARDIVSLRLIRSCAEYGTCADESLQSSYEWVDKDKLR